jgi:3-oxoacyl-[acyl-carrier-protein] synthase-3
MASPGFQFRSVAIEAMGSVVPPVALTSVQIEQQLAPLYERLRLPEGRLELMTGIRERHFWPDARLPSAASAEAGEAALARSHFPRESIDLVVHCGVCRDRLEPSTAAYVHGLLGLSPHCQILDISNACLGFLNALCLVGGLIESGQIRRALVVSGENGRPLLDRTIRTLLEGDFNRKTIKPYFANLTIGAGAVAYVIGHRDEVEAPVAQLLGGVVETDSSANQLCQGDAAGTGELEMLTEAELLLEAGLKVAARGWERFQQHLGWSADMLDRFVCHQVGRAHQRRLVETLALDPAKDFTTFEYLGNIGSVSLPITLAQAIDSGALAKGQKAALLGIGSGLSAMMMGVAT